MGSGIDIKRNRKLGILLAQLFYIIPKGSANNVVNVCIELLSSRSIGISWNIME